MIELANRLSVRLSTMPPLTLKNLCKPGAAPGYVLDTGITIRNISIADAIKKVVKNIKERMEKIEALSGREIGKFYIGKSHIHTRKRRTFNPDNPNTWAIGCGIPGRYRDHMKTSYGKNGLIVVAVTTKHSIPKDCIDKGYITHQEEYALTLEKRLIQKYIKDDDRLANTGTDPGHTDGGKSVAYVVYMAFTLEGKCV